MKTVIENVLLALPGGLAAGSAVIEDGLISSVSKGLRTEPFPDAVIIDGDGCILAPGFIDLHCHGGAGSDVNDATVEALETVGSFHLRNGTTSWAPTLSVDPLPVLERAFDEVRSFREGNAPGRIFCLGAHFESPWIALSRKGCQAAERILPFDDSARDFIEAHSSAISRITLAPELPGAMDFIPRLRELGIVVSGGHTDADADLFTAAADRGMTMVTHLYNAMSSVRKDGPFRRCGALEAALTDDRLYAEVICDGYHVPFEMIEIARRCKGRDRFMLCSDANRGAGMRSGGTVFTCGQEAVIENGIAMLKDRSSLASSVTPLAGMVRHLVQIVGVPVHEALAAASRVPAAAAGIAESKGTIEAGKDADLVLLDAELSVRSVWRGGVRFC